MKRYIYIAIALLFCTTAQAGSTALYYQSETWNAAHIIHELTDCHSIPWEDFYWQIQLDVNEWVESYPKRERGRLSGLVWGTVLDSAEYTWSCS